MTDPMRPLIAAAVQLVNHPEDTVAQETFAKQLIEPRQVALTVVTLAIMAGQGVRVGPPIPKPRLQ